MNAWLNLKSQRRHLADNWEMITYCGKSMYVPADVHRAPPSRWKMLGKVELQSLGSRKIIASDLCLSCAALAQPHYFESETGQKFGEPIERKFVAPFVVNVYERGANLPVETLEFDSRKSLGIFFENGATMDPCRYYEVTTSG